MKLEKWNPEHMENGVYVVPKGITEIGNGAFQGCSSLVSIKFPNGLMHIGPWAFYGCTSLASLELPDGVTHIGCGAFRGCASLASITYQGHEEKVVCIDAIVMRIKNQRQSGELHLSLGRCLKMDDGQWKNEKIYVVSQGELSAHGISFKEAKEDLRFKQLKERGKEVFDHLTMDSEIAIEEAIGAYRVLTGACRYGVEQFIASLPKVKESYTVKEIIDLTEGHYGHESFNRFFEQKIS